MARNVSIDVDDATVAVSLAKSGTVVTIGAEYRIGGGGVDAMRRVQFKPADFTAAERTALLNAYNIVLAKARATEGV